MGAVNLYPRSFLRLILLGNILAALPLLGAVGYAALTVDDLARRSDHAVQQASQAAALSQALPEQLDQMERIVRQYEVLRDPSLIEAYAEVHREWQASMAEYAGIPLFADLALRLDAVRRAEEAVFAKVGVGATALRQKKVAILALKRELRPLLDDANRLVQAERGAGRLRATALWQKLLAAVLAALGLSGLLLWSGRRLVARLWSRFERVVLALGEGKLDRRIRFDGPADMQRVGDRLEWLRRRLLKLESERTRVMRHTSHELKTPLATLREGASLLSEGVAGPLTPQQAKIAGIMQANAVRLQGLIDGLLRMQQASHARDQMATAAVRFDTVIEQTIATYQLAARDRRLRICGSLAPLTVEGDGEALATLASNLISNAIKFSPDGGAVRIELSCEGHAAVLDVSDEGPGISAADRERLFEPFYRGAAAKGVAGAGLGLAIAHEFALAHRGSLAVVEQERGAHFRARLPLAEQAA